jgi:hypothetical protein
MTTKKSFDVNKSWVKLIAAALLLDALILTAFVTSTPARSPASTWLTYAYELKYKLSPLNPKTASGEAKLVTLHKNASSVPREECIACHGNKAYSAFPLHKIHLTSDLLPGLACPNCHQSVTLQQQNNRYVVRWVNVGFCKQCHSEFPGLQPNSPMKPTDFQADCTTCHSGNHAFRHGKPYLSQIIAPRECKVCHGGLVLPWTPLHEQDNWLALHGPEALRVGQASCFKCHDFGLQFCDKCHAQKPPSHTPRDQWLVEHSARAQEDTRACFTCHKASYCKTCHVNHPADWLQKHPATVRANGTAKCEQCHSLSFCSYCHTAQGETS